ncbi:MAG: nuclear transport factor 2 family protein [Hyphomicrobium sp.]
MSISESQAVKVLYAAHEAWNKRDFNGLLELFDDNMIYWSTLGSDRSQTEIRGKPEFRTFLAAWQGMEGLSVPHSVRFKDGVASASVEFYVRDLRTGHAHSGTFRQVLTFRDGRILRMDEYHDAAAFGSFLALLNSESSTP